MSTCQPFSIMRLTHEAIRSGLNQIETLNENLSPATLSEYKAVFGDLKRVIVLHANQEDNVFYPPLEEKRPEITHAFTAEHEAEHQAFDQLTGYMDHLSEDATAFDEVQTAMTNWLAQHRAHLSHEEDILMKVLPEAFTYIESVAVVRSILEYDLDEYEQFQLAWVFNRLKGGQRKVYMGMLKGCSPEGKFADFAERVRPLLGAEEAKAFQEAELIA